MNNFYVSESAEYQDINLLLESSVKWMLLLDKNTFEHCSELFLKKLNLVPDAIFCIEPGEKTKNLNQVERIYEDLQEKGFDRHSLILNLGGGVVSDLGGFVAATFKRGVSYINVPTTLLSMVDAAQGGKTGVNFKGIKNQIGSFHPAKAVFYDLSFLKTLSKEELLSGFAEMLKHALISDVIHWDKLKQLDASDLSNFDEELVKASVAIKQGITEIDPFEKGERKKLNFGHTIGHAIEAYMTQKGEEITHGRAVAAGMICETKLSVKVGLNPEQGQEINQVLTRIYGNLNLLERDITSLMDIMSFDKKNKNGKLKFTLLTSIGNAVFDQELKSEEVEKCLLEYIQGK